MGFFEIFENFSTNYFQILQDIFGKQFKYFFLKLTVYHLKAK